jgi:NADH-quinone oxidoreductase subunit H
MVSDAMILSKEYFMGNMVNIPLIQPIVDYLLNVPFVGYIVAILLWKPMFALLFIPGLTALMIVLLFIIWFERKLTARIQCSQGFPQTIFPAVPDSDFHSRFTADTVYTGG